MLEKPSTSEQAVAAGIQSQNWERYDSHPQGPEFIAESYGEDLPHLLDEKRHPDGTPYLYDLIGRSGKRFVGRPSFAYRAFDSSQHPGWLVIETNENGEDGWRMYSQFAMVAWREREE